MSSQQWLSRSGRLIQLYSQDLKSLFKHKQQQKFKKKKTVYFQYKHLKFQFRIKRKIQEKKLRAPIGLQIFE